MWRRTLILMGMFLSVSLLLVPHGCATGGGGGSSGTDGTDKAPGGPGDLQNGNEGPDAASGDSEVNAVADSLVTLHPSAVTPWEGT